VSGARGQFILSEKHQLVYDFLDLFPYRLREVKCCIHEVCKLESEKPNSLFGEYTGNLVIMPLF